MVKTPAVIPKRLQAEELSAQPDCYYVGTLPGCATVRLLEYSHKTESKKEATQYWFSDASEDDDKPSFLPYTAVEVTENLRQL